MNARLGAARREDGSIFIETVVALAVLAMVLTGLYRVVADSASRRHQVEARREALMVARSTLASVGYVIPYDDGVTEGGQGGTRWRVEMRPCGSNAGATGVLYCIDVSVRDAQAGLPLARLSTRRFAPRA